MKLTKPGKLRSFAAYPSVGRTWEDSVNAVLVRTQGFALEAEIEVSGQRLRVMDDVSQPAVPRSPGELKVRLTALEIHGLSWEETFSGNPNREKRLEPLDGWSYDGYGQIVRINPTIVDFGIAQLAVGPSTHDHRCVGEYIRVRIDRLDVSTDISDT